MTGQSGRQGVLNEHTGTVHKRKQGGDRLEAECGALRRIRSQNLRAVLVDDIVTKTDVDRCGRCFDDGGGY